MRYALQIKHRYNFNIDIENKLDLYQCFIYDRYYGLSL